MNEAALQEKVVRHRYVAALQNAFIEKSRSTEPTNEIVRNGGIALDGNVLGAGSWSCSAGSPVVGKQTSRKPRDPQAHRRARCAAVPISALKSQGLLGNHSDGASEIDVSRFEETVLMTMQDTIENDRSDIARLLTYRQVAGRLQVSERTVFTLVKTGELRAVRFGGTVRIDPCDLSTFIERGKSGEGTANVG